MEDIQDGIKVSIQDGVVDDPEAVEVWYAGIGSFIGKYWVAREMWAMTITSTVTVEAPDKELLGSIATVVGTVVT